MTLDTIEVSGFTPAMYAMRNPLDSWSRGDTAITPEGDVLMGENDKNLSLRLQKAGPEHAKHLRMINVYVNIRAPRYWLTEMDTYRAGVEKISCSTMHTITKYPFRKEDFEFDDGVVVSTNMVHNVVHTMNTLRDMYIKEEDPERSKEIWRTLIQNLPQNYMQARTYMISYAALRNIVHQREGHKLKEWQQFIDWAHTLPESWMIFE